MPTNPQEFADLFGAKLVGEVPDVGGGPFGMARLAHLLHRRLTPSQGERPGRPTDSTWVSRPKVPMTEATQCRLAEIAAELSTPERQVSPMQVAAQLLEEALSRVQVKTDVHLKGAEGDAKDLAPSPGATVHRPADTKAGRGSKTEARGAVEDEVKVMPSEGAKGKSKRARRARGPAKGTRRHQA
jgi:hypothetical protein